MPGSTYRPASRASSTMVPEPGVAIGNYKLLQTTTGLYFVWEIEEQRRVSPYVKSLAVAEGLMRGLAGGET